MKFTHFGWYSKGRIKREPRDNLFPHDPHNEIIAPAFDEAGADEIEALAASVGATGARRPASE